MRQDVCAFEWQGCHFFGEEPDLHTGRGRAELSLDHGSGSL
jgi:hypothetical protein